MGMCAVEATTQLMSGQGYAERNSTLFCEQFRYLGHFKVDCRAEELAQGLHLVILMKDTGLEKDSPASSVPVYYEPLTSSTSEVRLLDQFRMTSLWHKSSAP